MSEAGAVEARGLTRRFGDKTAVQPFDLTVGPGGITGLLGPNGSGKSTFLRMLLGLVRPDAGTAAVDGEPLRGDGVAIRRRTSYMPGEIAFYGEMRGEEHLRWLLRGREDDAPQRALAVAEDLGLPLGRRVRGYSQGMKRQLFFAAAMAPRVRVRLLDEPTDGLDPSMRRQVLEVLERDAASGVTVLLSSHHLAEVERACERFVFLHEGRLLADESAEELLTRYSRVVHLTFDEADGVPGEEALRAGGTDEVRVAGARATIYLEARTPLEYLAQLARQDLPAPTSAEYGRVRMEELYRDLYGVEGL